MIIETNIQQITGLFDLPGNHFVQRTGIQNTRRMMMSQYDKSGFHIDGFTEKNPGIDDRIIHTACR